LDIACLRGQLPVKLFALSNRLIPGQPTGKFMRPPVSTQSERAIVLIDDDFKESPVGLSERCHIPTMTVDKRKSSHHIGGVNKPSMSEIRTLAIKLYEAGQKRKRKQPTEIWGEGRNTTWQDLPSESADVWDAVAICAFEHLGEP